MGVLTRSGLRRRVRRFAKVWVVVMTVALAVAGLQATADAVGASTPVTPLAPSSVIISPGEAGRVTSGRAIDVSAVFRTPGDTFVNSKGFGFTGAMTFSVHKNGSLVAQLYGSPNVAYSPRRIEGVLSDSQIPALDPGVYELRVIATNTNANGESASAETRSTFTVVEESDTHALDNSSIDYLPTGCRYCYLSGDPDGSLNQTWFAGIVPANSFVDIPAPLAELASDSYNPGGHNEGIGDAQYMFEVDPAYVGDVYLELYASSADSANAPGTIKLSYAELPLPATATIEYPHSMQGYVRSHPVFDAVKSEQNVLRVTNTGSSPMNVSVAPRAWTAWMTGDEQTLLDDEENADPTGEEIQQLIADSDPLLGGPNPSSEPNCSVTETGAASCWAAEGETSLQTAPSDRSSLDSLPCGLTTQDELRWTFLSRYEACRRWNVTLVLDPYGPTKTFVRAELGMRAFFQPRQGVARLVATTTWRGMDSASGIPHYDEDLVQSRIDYLCSGLISCPDSRSAEEFNTDNPIHTVDTGWLDVDIDTGDIESIAGDISVGFGVRQVEYSADWSVARGPFQIPLARCDAVTYLKHFGVNTQGCVISEYIPTLKFLPATETLIKESARHIRSAQAAGFPGGTVEDPLHRLRGTDRDRNRNLAIAKCKSELSGQPGSCDEYPFAASEEGCFTGGSCSVARIPLDDNRRSGSRLGSFYKGQRLLNGDAFSVVVIGSIPD